MNPSKSQIRNLRRDNEQWPPALKPCPRETWPKEIQGINSGAAKRIAVMRSREFLVQLFEEPNNTVRMSVNRTDWDWNKQRFRDDISWDDLQRLKAECGFGDKWACEVYPHDWHIVNVANMRHVFILQEPPSFAWVRAPVKSPRADT